MSTVFLVALVLFAAPAQADSRKVAILVGANRAVAGRGALRFAHSDAQRMAATLSAVGGFRPHDVLVLKDPEPDELLQGIEEFQSRIDGTSDETTLLFYFSGHADPQSVYTNGKPLALSLLKEKLERSSAKLKIGILDACHGGGWTRAKALVPAPAVEVPVTPLFSSQGTALLASSSGLERAHESDALGASFFTHHLIAGLRGAAEQTAAGEVTLQSAYRYAHTRTVRDSALAANEPQHPSFELNLHGRTDVVMAQLNTAPSVMTVSQSVGPVQLIALPSGQTLLELPAGERQVRLAVEPGQYVLGREQEGQVYAREVTVESGKTVTFDEASLSLVGKQFLATKEPLEPVAPRLFDVSAFGTLLFANPVLGSGFGGSVNVSFRLSPRWQVRARGLGVGWSGSAAYDNLLNFARLETVAWRTSALFGADAVFTVWALSFGTARRLEVQFALGTTAELTQRVSLGGVNAGGAPQQPLHLRWVPLSTSATVRLYLNRRLSIVVEGNQHWTAFEKDDGDVVATSQTIVFQAGLGIAL